MATLNPFDLLGDDAEDPSQQIAAAEQLKVVAQKKALAQEQGKPGARTQQNKPAQLPTKPPPPSQAGEILIPHKKKIELLMLLLKVLFQIK